MDKTLVVYYSHTGNNRFLAQQISQRLNCDIEEIKPIPNLNLLLLMGVSWGNKKLQKNLADYDRLILCGPVWMGSFISPLKSFIKKHQNEIKDWQFVSCCGSSYTLKDHKYGHEQVFRQIHELFPDLNINCTALPITMTMPEDQQEETQKMMEARLNEDNFNGIFLEKFNEFIKSVEN